MSALTVILNWDKKPVDSDLLKQMTDPVRHLGPDGVNYLIEGHIGFAALASHITPESAHERQPLKSEDGRFLLAADARIDNRSELLSELKGQLPRKDIITDADLILASYHKWNHDSPAHLIGDFAFVIWDKIEQQIFAAVDALGMRSLYYSQIGNTLCLATEALQILEHPGSDNQLSELALASWVINHPDPNISMFQKIHLLPSGTQLVTHQRELSTYHYWQPQLVPHIRYRCTREYEEHLYDILLRAVSDRMRTTSDVITTQLSGGMDSSVVTSLCNQLCPKQNKRLVTISQTYSNIKSCDETEYINSITSQLNLTNIKFDAEEIGMQGYPESHAPLLFSPFYRQDPVFDHTVSLIKEADANVLLTGHGGDEMTTGSPRCYLERGLRGDFHAFQEVYQAAKENHINPSKLFFHVMIAPLLANRMLHSIYYIFGRKPPKLFPEWMPKEAIEQLQLQKHYLKPCTTLFSSRSQQEMWQNLSYSIISPILIGRNHMSIPKGIETRHPFLDRRLAEFVFAVPPKLWRQNLFPKWLLRQTFNGLLPKTVCWRRDKTVFNSRNTQAIRQKQASVMKILSEETLGRMGLLNQSELQQYMLGKLAKPDYTFGVDINRLITIQAWLYKLNRNH